MRTVAKFGLVAGAAALLYLGYTQVKGALNAFSFSISRYGSPSLANGFLRVPIAVMFNNPSPVSITLDRVQAQIYIQKFGQWVKAGTIDQPLTLPPGQAEQVLVPNIDYSAILSGGLATNLVAITQALAQQSIPVKTDLAITYGDLHFTKSYQNQVSIA